MSLLGDYKIRMDQLAIVSSFFVYVADRKLEEAQTIRAATAARKMWEARHGEKCKIIVGKGSCSKLV